MNNPPKMLIVVGIFSILLIVGVFWHHSDNKAVPISKPLITQTVDTASSDTNNEVLRTVIANQQALQKQNEKIEAENKHLNSQGILSLQNTLQATQQALHNEIQKTKSLFENEVQGQQQALSTLQNQLAQSSNSKSSAYPVDTQNDSAQQVIGDVPDLSQSVSELSNTTSNNLTLAANTNTANNFQSSNIDFSKPNGQAPDSKALIPYYTIPANSTLNHVSMMTSLIGEVPVSGHLVSPAFPFKAIVGRKDLFAANGLSLPSNIAGMVLEGYSVGNMTMSCDRAYVTRALFVFNDGHFEVFPEADNNDATQLYPHNALGYLSDAYGNTCIIGKYITDAPKVIGNLALLGGVATGAGAVAQAQLSTINNAFQSQTQVTGNMGKFVGGAFVSGASQRALDWYTSRVSDIFDAVFIPATFRNPATQHVQVTQLVFNVTQTIPIDLNKQGRTLRYENTNNSISINTRLD